MHPIIYKIMSRAGAALFAIRRARFDSGAARHLWEVNMGNLLIIAACVILPFTPVIYIWCIKPRKSLKEGLKDWIEESADDI